MMPICGWTRTIANHDAVASGSVYLLRFPLHLHACRRTGLLVPVRREVDMRLLLSLLLSQELRVPIPQVEGQEESPAGTAGHLVERAVSIVPGKYMG